MSLSRGIRSAIFFYVSCAPCTQCMHERKRRKEANQSKKENAQLVMQQPGLIPQPVQYSTNIYWRDEIIAGPTPSRGRKKEIEASRTATSPVNSSGTTVVGSPTDAGDDSDGSDWNRKRYQRADELLWGQETEDEDEDYPNTHGSSIGLPGTDERLSTSSPRKSRSQRKRRNKELPPLAPVAGTKVGRSRKEVQWMLQPPPRAKVMAGKEPVTRERSGTSHSSRSSLRHRLNSNAGTDGRGSVRTRSRGRSQDPSSKDVATLNGQKHDRNFPSTEKPRRTSEGSSKRRGPPPPIDIPDLVHIKPDIIVDGPNDYFTASNAHGRRHTQTTTTRPPLSTINSLTSSASRSSSPHASQAMKSRQNLSSRSPSLRALQELATPSTTLNSQSVSPASEAKVPLPPAGSDDERDLRIRENKKYTPSELSWAPWVDEQEDVTNIFPQRWSMDL
ncbi:MAG: hypothetical protein M1834_008108 [Cirrosporium novae-zelandiae]|nr:MAG: hypothetical protein M1834_008108 [Cirrosporium novae-zelandiae]